jgi:hypothetical protein
VGYKSAKSVVKVELMDHYVPGYWEKRGYTDSAEIEPGPCVDINAGGERKYIEGPVKCSFRASFTPGDPSMAQ